MPEPLFERLYRETTTMNWQPTDDIRRRGDQRAARRRLTVAGGAFVAVLIVLSVALVAWRPSGTPVNVGGTPSPTTAPTTAPSSATLGPTPPSPGTLGPPSPGPVTTVPEAAMLQPADTNNATLNNQGPRGDWTLESTLYPCPTAIPHPNLTAISSRGRSFETVEGRHILQSVNAYAGSDAEREFAWLRQNIAACSRFTYGVEFTVTIHAQSFAGNESILVETLSTNGGAMFVIVRAGNLISEILARNFDQPSTRQFGQRAAGRMCPVTRTC